MQHFLAALLVTAVGFAAILPLAAADDPCGDSQTVRSLGVGRVGVFTGRCIGGHVVLHQTCFQVEWGVMTSLAGVGGHHLCETRAYVAPPLTLP